MSNSYTIGTDTGTGIDYTSYITIRVDGTACANYGSWRIPVIVSCADGSVCVARAQRGVTPSRNVKPHRKNHTSRRGIVRL